MTPQEFKAWFDGFTEAFSGVPAKAQWARVKERVAEIDGKAVTERIYVDRYWPTWQRYSPYPTWTTYLASAGAVSNSQSPSDLGVFGAAYNGAQALSANGTTKFDSYAAMSDLGRADAKSLARG